MQILQLSAQTKRGFFFRPFFLGLLVPEMLSSSPVSLIFGVAVEEEATFLKVTCKKKEGKSLFLLLLFLLLE